MKILFRRMLVLAVLVALTSGVMRAVPDKPQSAPTRTPLMDAELTGVAQ